MEGGGEREQSRRREREREGDGVEGMEGARVILKGDRGEERLVVEAGDEGRRGERGIAAAAAWKWKEED